MKSQIEKVSVNLLIENVSNSGLFGQGGFSALIKLILTSGEEKYYLFDTGGREEAFVDNCEKMEIPLDKIEGIILSHGHWDHVGALKWMTTKYPEIPIYCHPDAIKPRIRKLKDKKPRNIGILAAFDKEELEQVKSWKFTTTPVELQPGFLISGEVPRTNSVEKFPARLLTVQIEQPDGTWEQDLIKDDFSLYITLTNNSFVVVTGCAHTGIVNITNYATHLCQSNEIVGVIGGFHLIQATPEQMDFTVQHLKQYPLTHLGACHCTGFVAQTILYQNFPNEYRITSVGSQFHFPLISQSDLL